MADISVFKQERDRNIAFYKSFIERDQKWFEQVKKDWLENHPNATPEEAFCMGYLLSEEHPLSRTIHNIINFVEDFYPWKHLKSFASMRMIFDIYRNKGITYKTTIDIPEYYE